MKNIVVALSFAFLFSACAGKTPKPKYVEEKNQAKFATSHSFTEKPDQVLRAARAVLDQLTRASNPPTTDTLKNDDHTVSTGWVYSEVSRDKYVQYDYNGAPQRKNLALRRTYSYTVTPSLSGSQVAMNVEEEVQMVDLKTGETKNWKRVEAERAAYDLLLRKLREEIRRE